MMQTDFVEFVTPMLLPIAVGIAVLLLLSTLSFKNMYQYVLYFSAAISGGYLLVSHSQLTSFWTVLMGLDFYARLALVAFVFSASCTLLNVALFVASAQQLESSNTKENFSHSAACIDTSVSFEVPANLPDDDKQLFDLAFEK